MTNERKPNLATKTRHFPKKGERFINGEWVMEDTPVKQRPVSTAFDRRNFYRKQAGWPLLKER